jgi:hypothetical protein
MHVLSVIAWFVLGIGLLVLVIDSAVRTFVLPRGATPVVTRGAFIGLRSVFNAATKTVRTYNQRDSVMAL